MPTSNLPVQTQLEFHHNCTALMVGGSYYLHHLAYDSRCSTTIWNSNPISESKRQGASPDCPVPHLLLSSPIFDRPAATTTCQPVQLEVAQSFQVPASYFSEPPSPPSTVTVVAATLSFRMSVSPARYDSLL